MELAEAQKEKIKAEEKYRLQVKKELSETQKTKKKGPGCATLIGVIFLSIIIISVIISSLSKDTDSDRTEGAVKEELEDSVNGIPALAEFENSDFYSKYNFARGKSWDLKVGGQNHTYNTNQFGDFGFEIQTKEGVIVGYGLSFHNNAPLSDKDYVMIEKLLDMLAGDNSQSVLEFIKSNVEIRVKDEHTSVRDTVPYSWNEFNIYAARVGSSRIVSIQTR